MTDCYSGDIRTISIAQRQALVIDRRRSSSTELTRSVLVMVQEIVEAYVKLGDGQSRGGVRDLWVVSGPAAKT